MYIGNVRILLTKMCVRVEYLWKYLQTVHTSHILYQENRTHKEIKHVLNLNEFAVSATRVRLLSVTFFEMALGIRGSIHCQAQ